jgi:hypothetical protein
MEGGGRRTAVSTRTLPPAGKETVYVRLPWSHVTDVDAPREKEFIVNILLWLHMKWLKFQQERIEREIDRKGLHWSDPAARPIYNQLTAVAQQKNAIRVRLGRRVD